MKFEELQEGQVLINNNWPELKHFVYVTKVSDDHFEFLEFINFNPETSGEMFEADYMWMETGCVFSYKNQCGRGGSFERSGAHLILRCVTIADETTTEQIKVLHIL